MSPEDLKERLVRLESLVIEHGKDIAGLQRDFDNMHQLTRALGPLVGQMAALTERHDGLQRGFVDLRQEWRNDVHHFDNEIVNIRTNIVEAREEQLHEAKARVKEYQATRRWMVGTALASASVVIAALAIFFG